MQLQEKNQEIARINFETVNNACSKETYSKETYSKSPNYSSKFTEEKAYSNSNVSNFCFSPNDFNNVNIQDCTKKYSQIYKTVEKKESEIVDKFSEDRNFHQILRDFDSTNFKRDIIYDQQKIDDLIANQKIINQLNLDPKIKDEMRLNIFKEKIQALNTLEYTGLNPPMPSDSKFSFGSDEKAILVIGSEENRGSEIDYLSRNSIKNKEFSPNELSKRRMSSEIIEKNLHNLFNANTNIISHSTEENERRISQISFQGGSKEGTEIDLELTKSEFEEN